MKIGIKKLVEVEAKTLHIHLKVRDEFGGKITDQDGQVLIDKEDGYVPDFMPGEHHGDYLILDIDLDTGKILNWKKPSAEQIETFIAGREDR